MHRTKRQQRLPTNNKEIDPKMHLHNGKRISEPKRQLKDNNMQPSNRVSVKRVRIDPPDNDEDTYVSSHHTRYPARDNFATSIDDSPDENSYMNDGLEGDDRDEDLGEIVVKESASAPNSRLEEDFTSLSSQLSYEWNTDSTLEAAASEV